MTEGQTDGQTSYFVGFATSGLNHKFVPAQVQRSNQNFESHLFSLLNTRQWVQF